MDIRVSGHQLDTGEALQQHVGDRMNGIADKYFARAISAHATFGRGPHEALTCDIVAHVMQGVVLKGHHEARDAHVAFEGAADKIEKQLRRYVRRLKDRNGTNVPAAPTELELNAAYTDEEAGEAPLIIAETRVDIPTASVSDAVMMLDLRNTNALLFVNAGTAQHNMVYRRNDGSIGWVEPHRP
jgi:ribosomal subunit interface protein